MDESLEVSCDSSSPLAALGPAYRRLGWIPVCDEQTPRLAPEAMSRRGDLSFTLLVKLLAVPSVLPQFSFGCGGAALGLFVAKGLEVLAWQS